MSSVCQPLSTVSTQAEVCLTLGTPQYAIRLTLSIASFEVDCHHCLSQWRFTYLPCVYLLEVSCKMSWKIITEKHNRITMSMSSFQEI